MQAEYKKQVEGSKMISPLLVILGLIEGINSKSRYLGGI